MNSTFYEFIKVDGPVKNRKTLFASFRRSLSSTPIGEPESSPADGRINWFQLVWTPVFTGVTKKTTFKKLGQMMLEAQETAFHIEWGITDSNFLNIRQPIDNNKKGE